MKRATALAQVSQILLDIQLPHPTRVGIDGVDGSGKTWLADELAHELKRRRQRVLRVSLDDFHNPREERYRQGRASPAGFYHDSYNYDAFISHVLEPLGPSGNLRFKKRHFDLERDAPVPELFQAARADAIVLVDGIFLQRPLLQPYWDFTIFVQTDFQITLERMLQRDRETTNNPGETRRMFAARYRPGQALYLAEVKPAALADLLWDNNHIDSPEIRIGT